MPDAEARRQAETRRRFEDVEGKLNEVHSEVFTLWGFVEKQRRQIETLQKKVAGLAKRNNRRSGRNSRRR